MLSCRFHNLGLCCQPVESKTRTSHRRGGSGRAGASAGPTRLQIRSFLLKRDFPCKQDTQQNAAESIFLVSLLRGLGFHLKFLIFCFSAGRPNCTVIWHCVCDVELRVQRRTPILTKTFSSKSPSEPPFWIPRWAPPGAQEFAVQNSSIESLRSEDGEKFFPVEVSRSSVALIGATAIRL